MSHKLESDLKVSSLKTRVYDGFHTLRRHIGSIGTVVHQKTDLNTIATHTDRGHCGLPRIALNAD
jgi:hypothetical protein